MDRICFKRKPHFSFYEFIILFFFSLAAIFALIALLIYFYLHDTNFKQTDFILWITLVLVLFPFVTFVAILGMMSTSPRAVFLNETTIVFRALFSKKIIDLASIKSIKKEKIGYGISLLYPRESTIEYGECIVFKINNRKSILPNPLSIFLDSIYTKDSKTTLERHNAILFILEKRKDCVEPGLIEELIAKNEEYQKYTFLEKSK